MKMEGKRESSVITASVGVLVYVPLWGLWCQRPQGTLQSLSAALE